MCLCYLTMLKETFNSSLLSSISNYQLTGGKTSFRDKPLNNFHQVPQLGCNQKWHQQSAPVLGVQQHGFQNKLLQKGGIQYCLIKHQYNVLLLQCTVLIELLHFLHSVIDRNAKLVQLEEFHEKTRVRPWNM